MGYYSDLRILGGHPSARRFTPRLYDILKKELNFRKVNKIIELWLKKSKSNRLHSQKLLKNELNGLLILAHALGVSRPCILEVRGNTDYIRWLNEIQVNNNKNK